jgi:hypothetical protein
LPVEEFCVRQAVLERSPDFVVVGVDPDLLEGDDVVGRVCEIVCDGAGALVAFLCDILEAPVDGQRVEGRGGAGTMYQQLRVSRRSAGIGDVTV